MIYDQASFNCVQALRGACARRRTFGWMMVVLAGLSIRADLAGVNSRAIVKSGVSAVDSSGDLLVVSDLDTVLENHGGDHLCQVGEPP